MVRSRGGWEAGMWPGGHGSAAARLVMPVAALAAADSRATTSVIRTGASYAILLATFDEVITSSPANPSVTYVPGHLCYPSCRLFTYKPETGQGAGFLGRSRSSPINRYCTSQRPLSFESTKVV